MVNDIVNDIVMTLHAPSITDLSIPELLSQWPLLDQHANASSNAAADAVEWDAAAVADSVAAAAVVVVVFQRLISYSILGSECCVLWRIELSSVCHRWLVWSLKLFLIGLRWSS